MRLAKTVCMVFIVFIAVAGLFVASSALPQKKEELQSFSGLYIPPVKTNPAHASPELNYYQCTDPDTKYPPDRGVAAFTFDDGCRTDYFIAYPILKKYGIRATSYIIPGYIESANLNYLNWEQVKEMAAYGWVFGCHTYAHKDLTKMTADEIRQSMEKVDASFLAQGLPIPQTAAFPYGKYNKKVIKAMQPYRKQMRKAYYESKLIDLKKADPYGIDSVSADMHTEQQLKRLKKLVDLACARKKAIVLRIHGFYQKKPGDLGKYAVQAKVSLFEALVQYCIEKGCLFVTMEELMALYS